MTTQIFDFIRYVDQSSFVYLNQLIPRSYFFDVAFVLLTVAGYTGLIWFLIAAAIHIKHKRRKDHLLRDIIIANGFSFITVDVLIKNLVHRPRPEMSLLAIQPLFDPLTSYSFPSGHAAAAFASLAVLYPHLGVKGRIISFCTAFWICFSRIYLGKHYPLDLITGAVVGWLIGKIALRAGEVLSKKMKRA